MIRVRAVGRYGSKEGVNVAEGGVPVVEGGRLGIGEDVGVRGSG